MIKEASKEQLWSCIQRYLSFEEPSLRWQKLFFQSTKLSKAANGLKDLRAQEDAFRQVFFSGKPTRKELIFTYCFALEMAKRFHPLAFESWVKDIGEEQSAPDPGLDREISIVLPELESLGGRGHIAKSIWCWILHCLRTSPSWSCLREEGPWTGEALSRFALQFLAEMENLAAKDQTTAQGSEILQRLLCEWRAELPSAFLPKHLLLVEGQTELVLLSRFAELKELHLNGLGVHLISCGGSQQILRRYLQWRDLTVLPISLVADADALETLSVIADMLRDNDKLSLWERGEIEDMLPPGLVARTVTKFFLEQGVSLRLTAENLKGEKSMVERLEKLWREHGLGDFDKVKFAEFLAELLNEEAEIPAQASIILDEIEESALSTAL